MVNERGGFISPIFPVFIEVGHPVDSNLQSFHELCEFTSYGFSHYLQGVALCQRV
jgi:hypothetical protein